jgi:hypothetical protein
MGEGLTLFLNIIIIIIILIIINPQPKRAAELLSSVLSYTTFSSINILMSNG